MRLMRTWMLVMLALALPWAAPAHGGDDGDLVDDDRYVRVLAGKSLGEGVGFPGLFEVASAIREKYLLIGNGREEPGAFPFWYFHEKGPWKLVIVGETDHQRGGYRTSIRAIYVEGDGAPATAKGVRIGDPESKVVSTYGADSKSFDAKLHGFGPNTVSWNRDGPPDLTQREEIESSFASGRYYPAISTIFAFEDGKVSRIAVVRSLNPVPLWLRPTPDRAKPSRVRIDPKATTPRIEATPAGGSTLVVPPVPALTPATVAAFRISVPTKWTREGDRWKAPEGPEFVEVRTADAAADGPAEEWIDREAKRLGGNELWPPNDAPLLDVAKAIGVDEARAHQSFTAGATAEDLGLRVYTLMLRKGGRGTSVAVARRALRDHESPDGVELARQVLTSFRIGR